MLEANYRSAPVANITEHIIARSLKRYGLGTSDNADVSKASGTNVSEVISYLPRNRRNGR